MTKNIHLIYFAKSIDYHRSIARDITSTSLPPMCSADSMKTIYGVENGPSSSQSTEIE